MISPRSRPVLGLAVALGALGALMMAAPAVAPHAVTPPHATPDRLVPANADPSHPRWTVMCAKLAAFPGPSTVIVDSASGSRRAVDARLRDLTSTCHNPSQRIVGRVDTKSTRVSLDRVEQVIDAYYNAYPEIDGIVLDNLEGDPDAPTRHPTDPPELTVAAYYQHIFAYVRAKNVTQGWVTSTTRLPRTNWVLGHAGTGDAATWQLSTPVVDNVVVFERGKETYRTWSAPARAWGREAPAFSHLVYAVVPNEAGYTFRPAHVLTRAAT